MLRDARDGVLLPALDKLIATLRQMAHALAAQPMLSRTHGQTASPTTLGKEIANVVARLQRQRAQIAGVALQRQDQRRGRQLQRARRRLSRSRLAGACASASSSRSASSATPTRRRSNRTTASPNSATRSRRANTILIDFCRDIWGYISLGYFRQAVEGRRSRFVDHAAQGQPDRLRERRGQLRRGQRAARALLPRSCRSRAGSAT